MKHEDIPSLFCIEIEGYSWCDYPFKLSDTDMVKALLLSEDVRNVTYIEGPLCMRDILEIKDGMWRGIPVHLGKNKDYIYEDRVSCHGEKILWITFFCKNEPYVNLIFTCPWATRSWYQKIYYFFKGE